MKVEMMNDTCTTEYPVDILRARAGFARGLSEIDKAEKAFGERIKLYRERAYAFYTRQREQAREDFRRDVAINPFTAAYPDLFDERPIETDELQCDRFSITELKALADIAESLTLTRHEIALLQKAETHDYVSRTAVLMRRLYAEWPEDPPPLVKHEVPEKKAEKAPAKRLPWWLR